MLLTHHSIKKNVDFTRFLLISDVWWLKISCTILVSLANLVHVASHFLQCQGEPHGWPSWTNCPRRETKNSSQRTHICREEQFDIGFLCLMPGTCKITMMATTSAEHWHFCNATIFKAEFTTTKIAQFGLQCKVQI